MWARGPGTWLAGPPLGSPDARQGACPGRGPCEWRGGHDFGSAPLVEQVRCIFLEKSAFGGPHGFSVRGGREKGVVVSRVAFGGPAHKAALLPGDRILGANGIPFHNIRHRDALQILCRSKRLRLTISRRCPVFPHSLSACYMWVDRTGRPVSPPTEDHHFDPGLLKRTPSYRDGKEKAKYKKMLVLVEKGLTLGLMIRGGAEYGLGIYITGVDEASAADLAGLQVGDQILSVNDNDFTSITHDDAVSLLQRSPRMSIVVRSVGKIPHSTIPYNTSGSPTAGTSTWYVEPPPPPHSPRQELSRKGSPRKREPLEEPQASTSSSDRAEMRLDWKATKLLSENQRLTLSFFSNEYQTGTMAVDAFVAELFDILDTQEKFTLMTEIRALIRDEDLDHFDELIYRKEMKALKRKESMKLAVEIHAENVDNPGSSPKEVLKALSPRGSFRASTRRRQKQDLHHLTVPNERDPEDTHTPSEDSGVDLPNGTYYAHGSRKGSRVSTGSRESMLVENQLQRKPSVWRISPRSTMRRSFDATSASRDGNQGTRLRRTTLRRHSSGGEGVEERWSNHRPLEDRRWSIGSEVLDTPPRDGHLDAAQAVLDRLEAIVVSRRRPPSRLPHLSPVPPPLSPNSLFVPHNRVRRHRSLPDPHAIQARKKQQQWERMQQHRSASVRLPGHRVISEGEGRFRVIVKKTRPLLGIAIEGGINTTQPLPRIISIHNSGAAFEAGGLKVGHIILEVDGIKMSRRTHNEVAQLIAQAFYSTDRDQVEFLVTETTKNAEADVRRTSIMVFE